MAIDNFEFPNKFKSVWDNFTSIAKGGMGERALIYLILNLIAVPSMK
jgi:hypothetical protein